MYLPRESVSQAARWRVGAKVRQGAGYVAERRSWAAATPVPMTLAMVAVRGWRRPTAAAAVVTVAAMSASDPTAVAAAGSAATAAALVSLAWAVQLEMEMCKGWVGGCCSPASGA